MNKFGKHETQKVSQDIVDAADSGMVSDGYIDTYSTPRGTSGAGTERLKIAALDNLHHKVMYAPVTTIQVQS